MDLTTTHHFPDIGDLDTVLTRDGDTCLGFTYGCHGVMPLVPLVHHVTRDAVLANFAVVVRRTARKRVPLHGVNCHLSIEFAWLRSGVLIVTTMVNPFVSNDATPGLHPFFDNAESRIYAPSAANALLNTARQFETDATVYSNGAPNGNLPNHFLHPPYEYYTFRVHEPDDADYLNSLQADAIRDATTTTPSNARQYAMIAPATEDVPSVAEPNTVAIWRKFQNGIAHARRRGVMMTVLDRKFGLGTGTLVPFYSRRAHYTFLSTSGISAHGRIQKLCVQLGIQYHSPIRDHLCIEAPADFHPVSGGDSIMGGQGVTGGVALCDPGNGPCVNLSRVDEIREDETRHMPKELPHGMGDEAPRRQQSESDNARHEDAQLRKRRRTTGQTTMAAPLSRGGQEQENPTGEDIIEPERRKTTQETVDNATGSGESVKGNNPAMWTCDQCGIKIKGKKGNLSRHILNKHEKVRPYKCLEKGCGRSFQTRLNLVRHEKAVHEGRPFPCPHCTRAFKYELDLSSHVTAVHEQVDSQLACDVCGSCFARRSTLNRHRENVHKHSSGASAASQSQSNPQQ